MEGNYISLDDVTTARIANGPQHLRTLISEFDQQKTPNHEQYILHQLDSLQSLIKVVSIGDDFHFYYYNLLGRPIIENEKEAIARFIWDNKEKANYLAHNSEANLEEGFKKWMQENWQSFLTDESGKELHQKQKPFLNGGEFLVESYQDISLGHAFAKLKTKGEELELAKEKRQETEKRTKWAFFSPKQAISKETAEKQKAPDKGMKN